MWEHDTVQDTSAGEPKSLFAAGEDPDRFCACFGLRKASRAVTQYYDAALRPSGLRATQFSVLAVLADGEPMTVHGLAERLVTDRTTLTRNLKPLEREGLLTVTRGADKRSRRIVISDKGVDVLKTALPLWQKAQDTIVSGIGDGRFLGLLTELDMAVSLAQSSTRDL